MPCPSVRPSILLSVPGTAYAAKPSNLFYETQYTRTKYCCPHLQCTHRPPLASGSVEDTGQDGRAHVQGHYGTAPSYLSQLVRVADLPGRRSLRSARTNRLLVPSVKRETVYRRRPGLPSRRTHHLEQPASQRDICPVSVDLPSAFKNISVPVVVPQHYD